MALLVWSQLDLFSHGAVELDKRSARMVWMTDLERDRRTGGQWLRAIKAYLEFGAGDAWRRLSDPAQRNCPERDWYVGGIRTLNGISVQFGKDSKRSTVPRAKPLPAAKLTASRSRGWIVAELLRVDPKLTDKKLLLRLSHVKLAGMLLEARKRLQEESYAARPARKKAVRGTLPELPQRDVRRSIPAVALRRSA